MTPTATAAIESGATNCKVLDTKRQNKNNSETEGNEDPGISVKNICTCQFGGLVLAAAGRLPFPWRS
jgi:hypothetical protein